jgi:hypothetical protein
MSLREYILRSQAALRKELDEIRYRLLLINARIPEDEESVTIEDVLSARSLPGDTSATDTEELKALRYDTEQALGGANIDWSLVDAQLRD